MKYFIILIVIGLSMLLISHPMEPFTNLELFKHKYMQLSTGDSKSFFELRESFLTPKYFLHDCGISLITISTLFILLLNIGKGYIVTPSKKIYFTLLAIVLPFISVAGFAFDLFQGMDRIEFPWWADTLAIPLSGIPIDLIILLIWSFTHLIFINNKEISAVKFQLSKIKKINYWLLIISSITTIIVILTLLDGLYWYGIPGLLWIYYYLSIGLINTDNTSLNKS